MVQLWELPNVGVLTDSLGRLRIEDLRPGEYTVVVGTIGREFELRRVQVAGADTAQVQVTLFPMHLPLTGSSPSLPDSILLGEARHLLPAVLRDTAALEFFAGLTLPGDTTLVWAPWWPDPDLVSGAGGRSVRVTSRCDDCVASTSWSIEGGRLNRTAAPHVRLGVHAAPTGSPRIAFCFDEAIPGSEHFHNCDGLGTESSITYFRFPDGTWLRVSSRYWPFPRSSRP